jgi:hypothetical protein
MADKEMSDIEKLNRYEKLQMQKRMQEGTKNLGAVEALKTGALNVYDYIFPPSDSTIDARAKEASNLEDILYQKRFEEKMQHDRLKNNAGVNGF